VLNIYAPEKTITIPAKSIIRSPWMTAGIVKSSHTCEKLFKKTIGIDKDNPNVINYKTYRNKLNSIKRTAKKKYYEGQINTFKNDSYKLWQVLKDIIGKSNDKTSSISDQFKINGALENDPTKIANGFCSFYTGLGKNLAAKIPIVNKKYSDYLPERSEKSFFIAPTNEFEIYKIIGNLKPKKSASDDGISNLLIKKLREVIVIPLTIIINKTIETGIVPDIFKVAKIIPIYKSKQKDLFINYRPISILPSFSKIMEKILHKRLYQFINSNNMLYASQYGFRSKHSTGHAISEFYTKTLLNFENKLQTLSTFLDLSKAFDTIDHKILLSKLLNYGIRGKALDWFESYLNNRFQYVNYKNTESNKQKIEYGVPQGSVLGPLLFILYINDLPTVLKHSKAIIFADDTTIYTSSNDKNVLYENMNIDLNNLATWFNSNKLSLNLDKTNSMLLNPKRFKSSDQNLNILQIDNHIIKPKTDIKFLGIIINEHLDWTNNLKTTTSKLSKSVYVLNKVKNFLPTHTSTHTMKTLYNSFFLTHINYALLVWGPNLMVKQLNLITKLQKKAVRAVKNSSYNAHTNPLFKELELMKFSDIIDLNIAKFVFQFKSNSLPLLLMETYMHNDQIHDHNTRNRTNPRPPLAKLSVFKNSFIGKGPGLWYNLHQNLKNCGSIKKFSKEYKVKTISQY